MHGIWAELIQELFEVLLCDAIEDEVDLPLHLLQLTQHHAIVKESLVFSSLDEQPFHLVYFPADIFANCNINCVIGL